MKKLTPGRCAIFPPHAPRACHERALRGMHRLQVLQGHLAPTYWGRSPSEVAEYRKALLLCREELREFILEELCAPILVRLAWHDSGTYDACVPATRACVRLRHAID